MTIVDDLLANPGLYVGIDDVQGSDLRGAARILVTALPGNAGVSLDRHRHVVPDGRLALSEVGMPI